MTRMTEKVRSFFKLEQPPLKSSDLSLSQCLLSRRGVYALRSALLVSSVTVAPALALNRMTAAGIGLNEAEQCFTTCWTELYPDRLF